MRLPLVLALFFLTLPGQAGDTPNGPGAAISTDKAHPDLLRLEKDLTAQKAEKKSGRVTPEQYQEWLIKFRSDLDAAAARVPPSLDNTAAHARITALLGESGQARAALSQALESNPGSPVLLRTKSRILYDQGDYPGAARDGLEAWEKSGRTDKAAWELYQISKGRIAPTAAETLSPPRTQGPAAVATDDSNMPYKLAVKGQAHAGDVPLPALGQTTPAHGTGNFPLWPLAVPFAGGLVAYGLYRGAKEDDDSKAAPSPAGKMAVPQEIALAPGGFLISANSGPARAAATVIKEALLKTAPEAAGSVVITVATIGIIVAAGVATIYGLNEMIAAQDKYNEAIDTHREDQKRSTQSHRIGHINEELENTELQPQPSSSGGNNRKGGRSSGPSSKYCTPPQGLGNIGGGDGTIDVILRNAERWLGPGYKQLGPGRYRSADNKRQFRMRDGDLNDSKQGPHVHFECIGPNGRDIIENSHVKILEQ